MEENLIARWRGQNNKAFRRQMSFVRKLTPHRGKRLDRLAEELHEAAFARISCLDCGNCCRRIPPIVTDEDALRLANHLSMPLQAFRQQYLTTDEDGDVVMNQSPCPFLGKDNRCAVYEQRPAACRKYPHTDARQFSDHLSYQGENACYCPAVYHILEEMKSRVPV